ncbi:ATP-binding protein [Streptomyces sp. NPDC057301]|uniref:ATP-binding protein n=1 Tax=Streptomyces sp. NPDC057301 TaxID=3346093 RepID=UPI003631B359
MLTSHRAADQVTNESRNAPGVTAARADRYRRPLEVIGQEKGYAAWQLRDSVEAVPETRRAVQLHLLTWGVDDEGTDKALLLVTELVANAIEHGATPLYLRLRRDENHLSITVIDGGNSSVSDVSPQPAADDAESGRGLHLVRALADFFSLSVTRSRSVAVARLAYAS